MESFLSLNELYKEIEEHIQKLGYNIYVEKDKEGNENIKKIAIYQNTSSYSGSKSSDSESESFDSRIDCHISIFESAILFYNSKRTCFIVSLDNCSCLGRRPEVNCQTIGETPENGNTSAVGLIIEVILSGKNSCKNKIINDILQAIHKSIHTLQYFKGNNWNCHCC